MKTSFYSFLLFSFFFSLGVDASKQNRNWIVHDSKAKKITMKDRLKNLSITVDYATGCKIGYLEVQGKNVLSSSGVFTSVETADGSMVSSNQANQVKVKVKSGECRISDITYGEIKETWIFKPEGDQINWTIHRVYNQDLKINDMAFPAWSFSDLSVWKGGILDNGGMVWAKYFEKNDTYGIHTAGATFWNPDENRSFRITPKVKNQEFLASKFYRNEKGEFVFTQYVTDHELKQRHQQERFVKGKTDVFKPNTLSKGEVMLSLTLQQIDYAKEYSRGTLPGIDSEAVRELMNTTGRYGVIDNGIIGANGWLTNWKCLHEPFFAQIGMALNDSNYIRNFSKTLDQERELAVLEDGRVLSRWHGITGDEIPGTYNMETGYYEAMWGYTVDSQTGQIINIAEQFHLNGDLDWLRSYKNSCEKILNWLIRRDSDNNGIFEMVNSHISEEKASDWLDIVWAGYENSFVNAQMYEALNLWAACEILLGDSEKALYYREVAARLKESFNKPVGRGGFWHPQKKQYVYWRDMDGEIHGDNLVTPINFAAIAFGLCDDPERIHAILEQIEQRTAAEKLFHWPLCFDSFKREEVHGNNWPFPKYENGDIFPTWGYLGIRAYMKYDKKLALKYINNILEQYRKDGLSSQRYDRVEQKGVGSDVLAGICTSVTALYRDVYGIRPKWNRMGLEPDLLPELNGTDFIYNLRNTAYRLKLSTDNYQMSTDQFSIKSCKAFGASMENNALHVYPLNQEEQVIILSNSANKPIELEMTEWEDDQCSWQVGSGHVCTILWDKELQEAPILTANGKSIAVEKNEDGKIFFKHTCHEPTTFQLQVRKID